MYLSWWLLCALLYGSGGISASPFWHERDVLKHEEEALLVGHQIKLSVKENITNAVLMNHKHREFDDAYTNQADFLPALHFFDAKAEMEKSEVYKIIRQMPKGGLLHCHDSAAVSGEYMFSLTYRENLYACTDPETMDMMFQFADSTPEMAGRECQLLSEMRADSENEAKLNKRIWSSITLVVDKPHEVYRNHVAVWESFQKIFDVVAPIISYRAVFEDWFYQVLLELYEDKVSYVEFRTGLHTLYELDGKEYNTTETIRIYQKVIDQFKEDFPDFFGVRLIYAKARFKDSIEKYINIYKEIKAAFPDFIVGFDLVGNEEQGFPLSHYAAELSTFPDDTNFVFHAGETAWYGEPADMDLLDAVLLNTSRIGHGYALLKHPAVMQIVKEREIAVEISPISNQVLMLVDDLRNHPAAGLLARGFPVVVTNDDPGFWGARALSYDWYELFMGCTGRDADLRVLKQLALNSLQYSGLSSADKSKAIAQFNDDWDIFLGKNIDQLIKLVMSCPSVTKGK